MRIGVDIDGVLNYRTEISIDYGTKFCVETGKGSLIAPEKQHLYDIFGWDETTENQYWYENGKYQMILSPATKFAPEVLQKLRREGHEIWIITGRSNTDKPIDGMPDSQTWETITKNWLAEQNIEYDGFGFAITDKSSYCQEHNIPIMIEDNPHYLSGFGADTYVMIYNQPYNRDSSTPNSIRVYSWYDIYSKIQKKIQELAQ